MERAGGGGEGVYLNREEDKYGMNEKMEHTANETRSTLTHSN